MSFFALLLLSSFIAQHTTDNSVETTVINESATLLDTPEELSNNLSHTIELFKKNWPVEDWIKTGFFDAEYISDINEYWLKFLPPSSASFYVLAILYTFLLALGVTGNFLVILLFLRSKSLRTPANSLIFNLAISDFFMIAKTPIFIYNCVYFGPALGDVACRIYGFLGGLTGTVTITTLSVISFDRYFVIKYPLNRSFSGVRSKLCLVVSWSYGFVFAVIPALDVGFGKYTYEGYLTSCSFDYLSNDIKIKRFIFIYFIFAWVVPFVLISFCYLNIFYVVATREAAQKKQKESFRHVKEEDSKKQEIKLAAIVFCTIFLWFLSWTPYATIALLGISEERNVITPLASMIPALFCKTASCLNSYIYALSHPKFREELKKLIYGDKESSRRKGNKVWSTDTSKDQLKPPFKDAAEVVEEVVAVKEVLEPTTTSFEDIENMPHPNSQLARQSTVVERFCVSFKNDPSNIRKLARKWSTKDKSKDEDETDGADEVSADN